MTKVEITDASEFHCFKLTLQPRYSENGLIHPPPIAIMLHATALVDLIHQCSTALCEWQAQTTMELILRTTGMSEDEARKAGLIA